MKPGFVYILQSQKNFEYYIGSSENVHTRLEQHNSGMVKATCNKRPYKLIYYQKFSSLNHAKKIEMKIKSWKRKDFIERIVREGRIRVSVDD